MLLRALSPSQRVGHHSPASAHNGLPRGSSTITFHVRCVGSPEDGNKSQQLIEGGDPDRESRNIDHLGDIATSGATTFSVFPGDLANDSNGHATFRQYLCLSEAL